MGKRVRETERKYEASDGFAEPGLGGLPTVTQVRTPEPVDLDAVYFDTPDLRLAVRGITLRRRTGGDDAGWHLKLPTGRADTRTEVHVPLGRGNHSTVPDELLAETAVHVRGAELRPVVRLKSHRERRRLLDAEGTELAEIAYDHVTAQILGTGSVAVSGWAETEVELLEGGPELLDAVEERLTAAGLRRSAAPSKLAHALGDRLTAAPRPAAPPSSLDSAGDAILAYLHEQAAAIAALDPAVRRDEFDAVHRMRVATRRLRSALKSFRRELDRKTTDPIGDELKWLAGVLGLERDREVLAERLDRRLAELDPEVATEVLERRLRGPAGQGHPQARAELLGELNGHRYFALLDRIDAVLAAPPCLERAKAPAGKAMKKAVRRDHRRLSRFVEAALALEPGRERDVALHEARKAAKRARYCGEAAQPVLGDAAARHTARMKTVQQLLGEHQDSVMCRIAIARLAGEAHAAGESVFPYTLLTLEERSRASAVEEQLPGAWREADQAV